MPTPPVDPFYTPTELATLMVSHVRCRRVRSVADFATGDGELLRAAAQRWPQAKLFGGDTNVSALAEVRKGFPKATLSRCDFLSTRSRARAYALREHSHDLILLNPPFSSRGNATRRITICGYELRGSSAATFVALSVEKLRAGGELVAILPAGTLASVKDAAVWTLVNSFGSLEILGEFDRTQFMGCDPRTTLVRFRRLHMRPLIRRRREEDPTSLDAERFRVGFLRGRQPVGKARVRPGFPSLPFVHTTEVRDNRVNLSARRIDARLPTVRGPAVILPRVCEPTSTKIAAVTSVSPFIISDCLFALTCQTRTDALMIAQMLVKEWALVRRIYTGTCARYTTCDRLINLLARLGVIVENHNVDDRWVQQIEPTTARARVRKSA